MTDFSPLDSALYESTPEKIAASLRYLRKTDAVMAALMPLVASPSAPVCVCGEPTLGVVHRADGPCYLPEQAPPAAVPTEGFRDSALNSARFRARCYALVGIVEGIAGLGRRWASDGERLKDTPEWVAFHNSVSAMRNGTAEPTSATQAPPAAVPAGFAEWLAREMPAGTIIGDPQWWAKLIARRFAQFAANKENGNG